ncbi:MAG TPA: septation protein A [Xanthobacteraceae bacterium]|nr:septation protein A [Xanthobacteraceae bacterium]
MNEPPPPPARLNPLAKLALDFGPLILFFFANSYRGIFFATAAFMVAVLAALALQYVLIRRIPIVPLVTAAIVLVFGGLTLWLQNETFIKVKPTIIYLMFSAILFIGLFTGRPLFELVLDGAFHLTEEGWKKLTLRWAIFFLALAILNEIVWRSVSTDTWVAFKTFGFVPLTILFALAQTPVFLRHAAKAPES